jgi:metallo-beta-lactamase family protein
MGLIQGSRFNEDLNWEPLKYDASTVDVVFITHSHVDHMGRLPKLYRDGFRGVVYAIGPTTELIRVALPDTLHKLGDEASQARREPLFSVDDMEQILKLLRPLSYRQRIALNDHVTVIGHDSGHVLGSAAWEFIIQEPDRTLRVLFPGDIGNPPAVLLNPIDYVRGVDYTLVESAYGNRIHEDRTTRRDILMSVVHDVYARGGTLMIPSFAVERTQELLLELDVLFEHGKLPSMPVFVDSPLAIAITQVYGQFSRYFNQSAREVLRDNRGIFQFPCTVLMRLESCGVRVNVSQGN